MLVTLLQIFYHLFNIYWYLMSIAIILSWIPGVLNYKIPGLIYQAGTAYLRPFMGKIVIGFIDITPIAGFIVYSVGLNFLSLVLTILYNM